MPWTWTVLRLSCALRLWTPDLESDDPPVAPIVGIRSIRAAHPAAPHGDILFRGVDSWRGERERFLIDQRRVHRRRNGDAEVSVCVVRLLTWRPPVIERNLYTHHLVRCRYRCCHPEHINIKVGSASSCRVVVRNRETFKEERRIVSPRALAAICAASRVPHRTSGVPRSRTEYLRRRHPPASFLCYYIPYLFKQRVDGTVRCLEVRVRVREPSILVNYRSLAYRRYLRQYVACVVLPLMQVSSRSSACRLDRLRHNIRGRLNRVPRSRCRGKRNVLRVIVIGQSGQGRPVVKLSSLRCPSVSMSRDLAGNATARLFLEILSVIVVGEPGQRSTVVQRTSFARSRVRVRRNFGSKSTRSLLLQVVSVVIIAKASQQPMVDSSRIDREPVGWIAYYGVVVVLDRKISFAVEVEPTTWIVELLVNKEVHPLPKTLKPQLQRTIVSTRNRRKLEVEAHESFPPSTADSTSK